MKSNPLRRLAHGVTLMLIAVFAVSGYLGLRAVVWRQDYQISAMIQSGILVSALVGGAIGLVYVLLGSTVWRFLRIDWLSVQIGALVGALLYGGYNAITPLTPLSNGESPLWRALQGAVDGLAIGALVGGLVLFVSGRALHLTQVELSRFLMLFVVIVLIAGMLLRIVSYIRVPEMVVLAAIVPLLLILKLIVGYLDRRSDYR
jgi:hypothetical protein